MATLSLDVATRASRARSADYVRSLFDREMGVTLHNARVGSPRDDAMRELTKTTTNLYAKRVLRELIQNAFDGASGSEVARILVRLDRREGTFGTLYVANSGQGFATSNVDAISNPALSNKRPGNFIGHKGLGFRSVELLSDDTQIFSMAGEGRLGAERFDGFCFRFASAADEQAWLAAKDAMAFADAVVGRTHRLQLPFPIETDPAEVPDFARQGFATLVRLPLRDEIAAARAMEEMRLLTDEKAPVTLFLDHLSSLTLETIDLEGRIEPKPLSRSGRNRRKSSRARGLTLEEVTVDRRRFLVASMPVDDAGFRASVDRAVTQRQPVEKWREWEGAPVVSVALPLAGDAKPGSFYAFLPMDTQAPFNGCLDAPFFPNTDRRGLDLSNPLNSFLLDSVADLCLAVADEIADGDNLSLELAGAAVDALSWNGDADRLLDACERAGMEVGALRLPTVRRKVEKSRWERLDIIFDWDDSSRKIIGGAWLVRVCDVPMLRRGLGPKRLEALHEFVDETEFTFEPAHANWAEWGPALAADLSRRRKAGRQSWEDFYSDLAGMPAVLPHLRGKKIFRTGEGVLGAANSSETLGQREFFISPEPEAVGRRRRKVAGTALFPPPSVAKRMEFADASLQWSPTVAKAMFDAGLATEYSLARVIAGIGRLLGGRPSKTVLLAALRWTFAAWLSHKSPDVEKALKGSGLQVPVTVGAFKPATIARFGAGWRETHGDLLADFCEAAAEGSRDVKAIRDALLASWECWPLKERGTAAEWLTFLRLIGVRDGLGPVVYKAQTHGVWSWRGLRRAADEPLALERWIGPEWRRALQEPARVEGFGYQSGSYTTDSTLFALPLQGEHASLSPRAKLAYARLVMAAVAEIKDEFLTTTLRRTAGNQDHVRWLSPLLSFLREAAWVPAVSGEEISWARPRACWYSNRADPMPRFVPRIDRSVRDALDASAAARDLFAKHLSLKLWADRTSAVQRLTLLGNLLERGVAETDHDSLRKAYRDAWQDWRAIEPRPALPVKLALAVQTAGRLTALRIEKGTEHPAVFVAEGEDPTLENLLVSLGHHLLTVPPNVGEGAASALALALGGEFRLGAAARPTIIVDDERLDISARGERLTGAGRDWLAEIAVLVLEFNVGFSNRNTGRTRQSLFEAFKRLRIVFARRVQVEIEEKAGDLPPELDGVLPVPDEERPTVVVQSVAGALDWPTLARISRGIAVAVDRAWLHTDMRMAFLAIASGQLVSSGLLDRPSDEAVARAFGQPVERVLEVYRSLRATSRRLFEFLVPVVYARSGSAAAQDLIDREHLLADDGDVLAALQFHGLDPSDAHALLDRCREADDLDDLRRSLGIDLGPFNAALAALGAPWVPLSFEKDLRTTFAARVSERRAVLEERVRDAHLATYDAGEALADYASERKLDWLTFDEAWARDRDELDNATIDVRIEALFAARYTSAPEVQGLVGLEATRQHNRAALVEAADRLRKLVSAWVAKDRTNRAAGPAWAGKAEQIARDAMATGALDFRQLTLAELPMALAFAGLWPSAMPRSIDLAELGLAVEDLEHQARAEKEAQDAELKRRRTVTVGNVEIDGGAEGAFQALAAALEGALSGKAVQARSGKADLREFPEDDQEPLRRRGGRGGGKDPEYMSDEKRTLIGFAGEYAAYRYLAKNVRNFSDEHWTSSIGRRFLALPAKQDDDGFDFCVSRTRGDLHFEVKAHEGDPGHVDLERSQVAAAVSCADGKKGTWSILYVAHATDPSRITVYELPNPFGPIGLNRFKPSSRQGVRLVVERQ
jgi:hypothetical protein